MAAHCSVAFPWLWFLVLVLVFTSFGFSSVPLLTCSENPDVGVTWAVVPSCTLLAARLLEAEGLGESVSLRPLPIHWLVMDDDVLSMELNGAYAVRDRRGGGQRQTTLAQRLQVAQASLLNGGGPAGAQEKRERKIRRPGECSRSSRCGTRFSFQPRFVTNPNAWTVARVSSGCLCFLSKFPFFRRLL